MWSLRVDCDLMAHNPVAGHFYHSGLHSLPLISFSTHVKVIPPSLLLSLKRNKKVPGGFVLRMALSLSLLMKPMIYLEEKEEEETEKI